MESLLTRSHDSDAANEVTSTPLPTAVSGTRTLRELVVKMFDLRTFQPTSSNPSIRAA